MPTPSTPADASPATPRPEPFSTDPIRRIVERIDSESETVIEARPGWKAIDLAELWMYRELVYFLCWRDIKVRYKQTALGAAWAILQPLALMVVFSAVLGRDYAQSDPAFPYPVFLYSGLLLWLFFSQAILAAGNSLVMSKDMITKVYFPRLTVTIAAIGPAAVDFVVALSILIAMMIYYGIAPGLGLLFVPVLLLLAFFAALGIGAILAALNVSYRDFRYILPFLVQIWMLATPSIYKDIYAAAPAPAKVAAASAGASDRAAQVPGDQLGGASAPDAAARGAVDIGPADIAAADSGPANSGEAVASPATPVRRVGWLEFNPLTPLVGAFRAAVLGGPIPWRSLAYSVATITATCVVGCFYFRRNERTFADVI